MTIETDSLSIASEHGISVRNSLYRNNGDGTFNDVTEKGRGAW